MTMSKYIWEKIGTIYQTQLRSIIITMVQTTHLCLINDGFSLCELINTILN